jgi:hypothetical protein
MRKLVLALLLLIPASSFATTYYASTGGSGSTCSIGSPCTIGTGIGKLASGDTLMLNDGTYNYQIRSVQPPSGSAGAPTIIKAINNRMAIIKPSAPVGGGFGIINLFNVAYITIDGIVEDGSLDTTNDGNDGFRLNSDDHIIIQNSEIRNNVSGDASTCAAAANGVEQTLGDHTGTFGSTFDQFLNNYVHDNGVKCTGGDGLGHGHGYYIQDSDNIIDGGSSNGNAGAGVQFRNGGGDPAAGLRNIARNMTMDANGRVGVFVTSFTSGSQIYNDVITNSTLYDGIGVDITNNAANTLVYNNTIYGMSTRCVFVDVGASGPTGPTNSAIKNNICWNTVAAILDTGTGTVCSNNLNVSGCGSTLGVTNPLFVSPGVNDFHLQAGSPAAGLGANLSATFTTDFDGITRLVPWDVGAFVASACTAPCPVQSNSAGNAGSGATLDVPYLASETTANLNVLAVTYCPDASCIASPSGGTVSATDDLGNAYTLISANTGATGVVTALLYSKAITGGSNVVHITASGTTGKFYLTGYASEWSGMDPVSPLDRSGTANGSGTSISVSTSLATTNPNDVIYGLGVNINQGEVIGAGFTQIQNARNEYKVVNATGTQTATWTSASGVWAANVAAFKATVTPPNNPTYLGFFAN